MPSYGAYNQSGRVAANKDNNNSQTNNRLAGFAPVSDMSNTIMSKSSRGPSTKAVAVSVHRGKDKQEPNNNSLCPTLPAQQNATVGGNMNQSDKRYINLPQGKTVASTSDLDRRVPLLDVNNAFQTPSKTKDNNVSSRTNPSSNMNIRNNLNIGNNIGNNTNFGTKANIGSNLNVGSNTNVSSSSYMNINMPKGKTASGVSDRNRKASAQNSSSVVQKTIITGSSRNNQQYQSNSSLDHSIPLQSSILVTRKSYGDSVSLSSFDSDSDLDKNIPMPDAEVPVKQQYYRKPVSRSSDRSDNDSDIDRHIPLPDAQPVVKENYYSKNMPKQRKAKHASNDETDLDRSIPMQDAERRGPLTYHKKQAPRSSHKSKSDSEIDSSISMSENEPTVRQNYYIKNTSQQSHKRKTENDLGRNIPLSNTEPVTKKKRSKKRSETEPAIAQINPFADHNIEYIDVDSVTTNVASSHVHKKRGHSYGKSVKQGSVIHASKKHHVDLRSSNQVAIAQSTEV